MSPVVMGPQLALLGSEVWVVAIGILAWVVAPKGPITPRALIVAGLLLSASAAAGGS